MIKEEEIRGNLLLPYLKDLGFDLSEISLEKSFSISLGKSKKIISGRSDILCTRNNQNLFIIELKNDEIVIQQKDIDQGISYARLLEGNIAPFVILSNGKITKIFDTITREELTEVNTLNDSSYWKNGLTLSTELDLKIRYEALKNFVSLSPENLKGFCKKQILNRMGTIIGDINSPYSKFIKSLHIQRQGLSDKFDNFLNSESSVFGIVGAAGVGKTNAVCSLALNNLEKSFVFFYNAALINKSPIEHIANDLNMVFSSKNESDTILKRLNELGEFLGKNILIFIDAIDESTDSKIKIELSEIALHLRSLNKIKLCISCKSNLWESLLISQGNRTYLFEELSKSHDPINDLKSSPGYLLEGFSEEELESIIPLYKSIFEFKGQISDSLKNELKNGFFLRIFSEVYSGKEIPKKVNDKELIKKYLNQSLEKTTIGVVKSLRILSKIGEVFLNYKYTSIDDFYKEGVEVNSLMDSLNLLLDDDIPEDLFARNILIKSNKEDTYNVSFYYSKIRDYIICFHSYKLHELTDEDFYSQLELFYQNYIGKSAILFYIDNASYSHRNTFIRFKKDKALNYVLSYDDFLNKNFKKFKDKFDPETQGDIGILLPKDLINRDGYALFPLNKSSSKDRIQYEDLGSPFSGSLDSNLFFKRWVISVYGSNELLLISNQNVVIHQKVFKELKEVIRKGKLNAYNSDILIREQISLIVYYYQKELEYVQEIEDYYLPRFDQIYPIDLNDLVKRVYKFRAKQYLIRSGVDRKFLHQKVEEAIQKNIKFPEVNIKGDFPPMEELYKIANILLAKGYKQLEEHHLPIPDVPIEDVKAFHREDMSKNWDMIRNVQYSESQARLYIETFLLYLESCYKEFVEYLFPTFKDKFRFYQTMPHKYNIYFKDSNPLKDGLLGYGKSDSESLTINFKEYVPEIHKQAFDQDNMISLRGFSLKEILYNSYHHTLKTYDGINTSKIDDYCIIRNWVYRLIKSDMDDVFVETDDF